MKTIDKLPRKVLIMIAKFFGHRSAEEMSDWHLADFISRSLTD